jgi:hypothetical protein
MKPWIDFVPNFLSESEQQSLISTIQTLKCVPEIGQCKTAIPSHDTIHFGPRQAYLVCVPQEFRARSAGPILEPFLPLTARIEDRYQAAFNSLQINRHYNQNSSTLPHSDSIHGHIVMLSLGYPRRFVLTYKFADKAKTLRRWRAGDTLFDRELPSGSLLTLYKNHQFDLNHQMPKADHLCDMRISIIWRYIAEPLTRNLGKQALMDGCWEYKDAQQKFLAMKPTPKEVSEEVTQ